MIGLVACSRHGPPHSYFQHNKVVEETGLGHLKLWLVCRCKCISFVPLPPAQWWPTPSVWPMADQAGGSLTNKGRLATSCACAATIMPPRKLAEREFTTDVYKICQRTIQVMEFLIRHFLWFGIHWGLWPHTRAATKQLKTSPSKGTPPVSWFSQNMIFWHFTDIESYTDKERQ